ncbi:MAG TPA: hypothetical protein VKX17_05845 [Planctomycetota bacterium]|nr:hypothetical protein [Planctomycetota bacterium]
MTMGTANKSLVAALALSLACIFAVSTKSAAASDYGYGYHGSYEHCEHRVFVPGYYETVVQHVCVCAERTEHRYFEPVYETRYHCGYATQYCVREGYYKDFYFPAKYEDRYVKVWHEGYYREASY